jgi:hypothetical protein
LSETTHIPATEEIIKWLPALTLVDDGRQRKHRDNLHDPGDDKNVDVGTQPDYSIDKRAARRSAIFWFAGGLDFGTALA